MRSGRQTHLKRERELLVKQRRAAKQAEKHARAAARRGEKQDEVGADPDAPSEPSP